MITFTLPLPPRVLSANARPGHWGSRYRANDKYRDLAFVMGLHALGGRSRPRWKAARQQSVFYFATSRHRDGDNLLGMLKPVWDGLQKAGILQNDSGLIHMPVRSALDKANPRVEITVEPV